MNIIKKLSTSLIIIIGLLSNTLIPGNELLNTYCTDLTHKATRLEQQDKDIAQELNNIATALTNFEKIFNPSEIDNQKKLPFSFFNQELLPCFNGLTSTNALVKPTSIFGTVALASMLTKPISSPDDPEFLETKAIITLLANNSQEMQQVRMLLTLVLRNLDQTAKKVFIQSNPLSTWAEYNQAQPSTLLSMIAQASGYANLANTLILTSNLGPRLINWGLSFYSPEFSGIIPVGELYPTLSLVGGLLGALSYNTRIQQAAQAKINNPISAAMAPFLQSLQTLTQACQALRSTQIPVFINLADELALPTKIDATWQNVTVIIRCLKTIARLDACLALATAQADGHITPATITQTSIETNMQQQNLAENLKTLWQIGSADTTNPWYFDSTFIMKVDDNTDAQAELFLKNLILSQTIGFVISPAQTPVRLPLLDISRIMASTKTNYVQNQKKEVLQSLFVAPYQS